MGSLGGNKGGGGKVGSGRGGGAVGSGGGDGATVGGALPTMTMRCNSWIAG